MTTEIDPICPLQAAMEGYQDDARSGGAVFVTATPAPNANSTAVRPVWVKALNRCRDSRCAGVPLAGSVAS